jgi:hypothetical protein
MDDVDDVVDAGDVVDADVSVEDEDDPNPSSVVDR